MFVELDRFGRYKECVNCGCLIDIDGWTAQEVFYRQFGYIDDRDKVFCKVCMKVDCNECFGSVK